MIRKFLKQNGWEKPKKFTDYILLLFIIIYIPVGYLILAVLASTGVFFIAELLVEWHKSIIGSQSFFGSSDRNWSR